MKIRAQLTLAIVAVAAIVVALAGLLVVLRFDQLSSRDMDRSLATRADEISADASRLGTLLNDTTFAVRLIRAGKVQAQSGPKMVFPLPAPAGYATVTADGRDWRSLTRVLVSGVELQVLRRLDDAEATHVEAVRIVDLAILLAVVLAAAAGWFLVGGGLRQQPQLAETPPASTGSTTTVAIEGPESITELVTAAGSATTAEPTPQRGLPREAEQALRLTLDNLATNLDRLLDDPELSVSQRHLVLAVMADDRARMVALLDDLSGTES